MINCKKDYKFYYQRDLQMTGIYSVRFNILYRLKDRRFKFYKSLRKTEYYLNCKKGVFGKFFAKVLRYRHSILCNKFQWTIPVNVFGPGLAIVHTGPIIVSGKASIGKNCRIHVGVNIGNAIVKNESGTPILGDNVYIGPGAKIFGPIYIGDNIAIGANAVVNKSFIEGNCTIAGVPAKKISDNTSDKYIIEIEKDI